MVQQAYADNLQTLIDVIARNMGLGINLVRLIRRTSGVRTLNDIKLRGKEIR